MTRPVSLLLPLTFAALLVLAGPAAAHGPRQRVVPGASESVVAGHLDDEQVVTYLLAAEAGQKLAITLQDSDGAAEVLVAMPRATETLPRGAVEGHAFSALLPATGDYRIIVRLTRDAILEGKATDYRLGITLQDGALPPDYADGLSGGPDFWAVAGVGASDLLNLRDRPSVQGAVLERLPDGAVLRNMGCAITGTTRWCHVTNPASGTEGWVAGRYLRESAGP